MNRVLLFFLLIPVSIFSEEMAQEGLLQIDATVKILSQADEDIWSLDLTKYTVSNRSISIHLQGFDGELTAVLTPVILDSDQILLKTSSVVKSSDTGEIISVSQKELFTSLEENIIFYPLGDMKNVPNVIIELLISRLNGVNIEDK